MQGQTWVKKVWKASEPTVALSHTHRVEPHDPEDPDGQGQVDDEDDDEQQNKEVEAALPPAIDANGVGVLGHRPGHTAALGGGDVLLLHHLLPGHKNRREKPLRRGSRHDREERVTDTDD